MVLAGNCFARANAVTQAVTSDLGFKAQSDALWQYLIATVFSAPFICRHGFVSTMPRHPVLHVARILLSVLGVQALDRGLEHQHVIALVMSLPFLVIIGAAGLLGERVGLNRWITAVVGFAAAIILLRPWESGFTLPTHLLLAAVVTWGGASLIAMRLTATEPHTAITMWFPVLLTPVDLVFSLQAGFEVPTGNILWRLTMGRAP